MYIPVYYMLCYVAFTYLYLRNIVIVTEVVQLTESLNVKVLEVDLIVETSDEYLEHIETPVFDFYSLSRLGWKSTVELSPEDVTAESQDKPVSLNLLPLS